MVSTELSLAPMESYYPTAAATGPHDEGCPDSAFEVPEIQASEQDEEAAAAAGGSSRLAAFDTASEVQQMAAQVLQRKQQRGPVAKQLAVSQQDPIYLLAAPDKNLRARKELLMSAASVNSNSSMDGGSARVAAVKEELAGVQARLRNALGLKESASDEINLDYYQPPLLKRASQDPLSPSGSFDSHTSFTSSKSNTHNRPNSSSSSSSSTAAAAAAKNTGTTKAAALSFRKPSTAAAAAVPSGSAARARAAGGSGGVGENAAGAKIYFDTSSEVAEMAARVLRRHNAAAS